MGITKTATVSLLAFLMMAVVPSVWACRSNIIFPGPATKTEGGQSQAGPEGLANDSDQDTEGLGRNPEELQVDIREAQVKRQQRLSIPVSPEHIQLVKISCTAPPVLRPEKYPLDPDLRWLASRLQFLLDRSARDRYTLTVELKQPVQGLSHVSSSRATLEEISTLVQLLEEDHLQAIVVDGYGEAVEFVLHAGQGAREKP